MVAKRARAWGCMRRAGYGLVLGPAESGLKIVQFQAVGRQVAERDAQFLSSPASRIVWDRCVAPGAAWTASTFTRGPWWGLS